MTFDESVEDYAKYFKKIHVPKRSDARLIEEFHTFLRACHDGSVISRDSLVKFINRYYIEYIAVREQVLRYFTEILEIYPKEKLCILIGKVSINKEGQNKLAKEFDAILEKCDPETVYTFATELNKFDKGKKKIVEKSDVLLKKCGEHFIDNIALMLASSEEGQEKLMPEYDGLLKRLLPDTVATFTKAFSKFEKGQERIIKDYPKLLRKCDRLDITTLAVAFSTFEAGQKKIMEDYDKILKKSNEMGIAEFVQAFSGFEEGRKKIVEDYEILLKRNEPIHAPYFIKAFASFENGQDLMVRDYEKLLKTSSGVIRVSEFVQEFSTFEKGQKLVIGDYDRLLQSCNRAYQDFFMAFLKSEEGKSFLKEKDILGYMVALNQKKGAIGMDDLCHTIKRNNLQESLNVFFEHLIKDKNDEKSNRYIGSIANRHIFQLNEGEDALTVMLSTEKGKYEVAYSPLLAQPLLRDAIKDKSGEVVMSLEVFREIEFATTNKENEAKAKRLNKKLEKSGIKWRYPRAHNMGILGRYNKNERIIPKGHGGIVDEEEAKEIKAPKPGDAVVIGLDYIEYER